MLLSQKTLILSLSFSFLTLTAFANVDSAFDQIRDNARHYKDPGAICEEVAREEFTQKFPSPRYEILVGVSYNVNGRTLGELDMVVIDNTTARAALVGEVKCYNELSKGLSKAKQQRKRFLTSISKFQNIVYIDVTTKEKLDSKIFAGVTEFVSISQKGGRNVGFDYELTLSLDEMSQLRDKMVQCQRVKECPLPH